MNNFTTSILVDQTPHQAFDAITNVHGWWSAEIQGDAAEFTYHFKDVHRCAMRLIELIPDKKVVWLVTYNDFNFIEDKTEWIGNKITLDVTPIDGQTQIRFTQEGLTPAYACYEVCSKAWTKYIGESLRNLITTGKGNPNPEED